MQEFIEIPASKRSISKRKPLFGVGINDATYLTSQKIEGKFYRCPYYRVWTNMLRRCFDKNNSNINPTYMNCTVCAEWLYFSNFKSWMEAQNWREKHLDKDLKIKNNKIYSPEGCMFISQAINNLLLDRAAYRGKFAIGVSWHEGANKYIASCNDGVKLVYLGLYTTEDEASEVYKQFKKKVIITIAHQQKDNKLKELLLKRANSY